MIYKWSYFEHAVTVRVIVIRLIVVIVEMKEAHDQLKPGSLENSRKNRGIHQGFCGPVITLPRFFDNANKEAQSQKIF